MLLIGILSALFAPKAMAQVPAACPAGSLSCSNQYCPATVVGSKLGCNANDVSITKITINRTGSNFSGTSCTGGQNITVDLNVTVQFGSATRYNIGVYLAQDGKAPEVPASAGGSAACTSAILPLSAPTGQIRNPFGSGTVPTPFLNLESPANVCGDGGKSTVPTAAYASAVGATTGTGMATFVVPNVVLPCGATTGALSGKLNIPFVVSWDQNGGACSGPTDVLPGTGSKCSVPSGAIGDVDVQVLPQITKTNTLTTISPGDTATYTITVANTTGVDLANVAFADAASVTLTDTPVVNPTQPYFYVTGVTCAATGGTCPTVTPATFVKSSTTNLNIASLSSGGTVVFTVTGQLLGAPTGTLANTGSITVSTSAATPPVITTTTSSTKTNAIVYPSLASQKTVAAVMDPIRGTTSPVNIPGTVAQYVITMSNTGQGRVDTDTAIVTDAIPANTRLYYSLPANTPSCPATGAAPVTFTDGSPSSTLTYTSAADLQYSTDNGASYAGTPTWVYVPATVTTSGTNPPGCYASNVTHIRANPKGRMAAGSSYSLKFQVYLL